MRNTATAIAITNLAAGLVGCGGESVASASPGTFDALRANRNLDRIERVLESPIWESFRAFGERARVGPLAGEEATSVARSPSMRAAGVDENLTGPRLALVPVIPEDGRGTTFVYDPATDAYRPRPGRQGAPEDGIRFILYAVSPQTGEPLVDTEIGHADLFDHGVPSGREVSLQFVVVSGDDVFLDYLLTGVVDDGDGPVSISGLVGASPDRVTFQIEALAAAGAAARTDVQIALSVPDGGFDVETAVSVAGTVPRDTAATDLRVQNFRDTIRFRFDAAAGPSTADLFVNGEMLASVRPGAAGPVFLGAGGEALEPDARRTLARMLDLPELLFRLFGDVLQPAAALIPLAPTL